MEPRNEDQDVQPDVLAGLVKDAIARITELEIRVAELDAQIAQLRDEANNPS